MHLNRILLAATALYATSLSLVSSQVTDEVYYDIFSNPKHQVVFGTLPGHLPITPATLSTIDLESNPSLLLLPDASTGKRYLCHVPQPPELDQETSKANSDDEKKKTLRSGLRLLEPMAGKDCLYYVHSWWTYEFCHNRHVRQYHPRTKEEEVANPEQKQDYFLGKFPGSAFPPSPAKNSKGNEVGETVTDLEEKFIETVKAEVHEHEVDGKSVTYLKETWGDGTFCAIGKAGPRMVEIQYHCSPYYEQISSVRETGSCRYLIHVQTPRLCTDAAFLPKQLDQGTSIVCEPVLNTELLETSTSSKRGRETYTPPHASHIHFVSSSVPNQPKGLVGIRDLLAAEYISKATTAGKAAPLPRGHHSIQAILEENQMKKAAAGAAGVGAGAASVAEAVKGAATAAAGPFTVKFKNGAAVVAAPGGVMGAAAGGDGRDPLLANLLSSPEFSQIWKKVTSAVADALADEVEEEEKKPSAAKKEGEKVDDAEADARMKAFHQAIRAVAGEMGGEGMPQFVVTEDGKLIFKESEASGKKKKVTSPLKKKTGGPVKGSGPGSAKAKLFAKDVPPKDKMVAEMRSPDDDDDDE